MAEVRSSHSDYPLGSIDLAAAIHPPPLYLPPSTLCPIINYHCPEEGSWMWYPPFISFSLFFHPICFLSQSFVSSLFHFTSYRSINLEMSEWISRMFPTLFLPLGQYSHVGNRRRTRNTFKRKLLRNIGASLLSPAHQLVTRCGRVAYALSLLSIESETSSDRHT